MKAKLLLIVSILLLTTNLLSANLSEDSLYNLDTKWTNQDGKSVQLKDYLGQPVILSMVYLTCGFMCPTIISEIQSIEAKLDKKIRKDVRVVLVSFDPDRDTPENMKAYAKKRKLDPSKWVMLTNKDDSKIRELAAVLGFKYQKT
ncbi:MAG: SCO family protein, partial [Bdellovibrionales bacterium]|nr:SCO family protein [Bdellovibrionales bacterium]